MTLWGILQNSEGESHSEKPSLKIFFKLELIYNVPSVSAVQQSDPVIHIYSFFSYYEFQDKL